MEVTLQNNQIQVRIASHGAEMTSLVDLESGRQMLWNADPEYWKRHSPVLFPIVGSVWEGVYRECGKEFRLGQHGFARDMEFNLLSQDDQSAFFELTSSEESHKLYPYDFRLVIGYELSGKTVKVVWKVINPSDGEIHFQIGAHPAFLLRNEDMTVGGAFRLKLDGKPVEAETNNGVRVYLLAYAAIFIASMLVISLDNFDFTTNFTAVAATFNNIGPGLNMVGPAGNFSEFSWISKLVLILDMLAGRLELYPLLVLFAPSVWRKNG